MFLHIHKGYNFTMYTICTQPSYYVNVKWADHRPVHLRDWTSSTSILNKSTCKIVSSLYIDHRVDVRCKRTAHADDRRMSAPTTHLSRDLWTCFVFQIRSKHASNHVSAVELQDGRTNDATIEVSVSVFVASACTCLRIVARAEMFPGSFQAR